MKNTILVTGGTGYVGSWLVKKLLENGHTIRLTVRDKKKIHKYQFLLDIASNTEGKLEIFEADLLVPGSFDTAAKGADMIAHLASPFILDVKNPQKDLVDPAVLGTTNVLQAANNSNSVKKVVLTSSIVAVYGDSIDMKKENISIFSEKHFNTSSSLSHQPYSYSKIQAEKKAWEIYNQQTNWDLVVMNPAYVMGPSLTNNSNSASLKNMKEILSGKFRFGVAELYFAYVDVRDVADAHVFALENQCDGRHILTSEVTDMLSFCNLIKSHYGNDYKLPNAFIPKWLLSTFSVFLGITKKYVKNNIGIPIQVDNTRSIEKLNMKYIPLKQTVKDMIDQIRSV